MRVLVDTNIVVSNLQSTRTDHDAVREALRLLVLGGWELCICSVQVFEFWAVATRPAHARGGLELSPSAAAAVMERVLRAYTLLPEPPDLVSRWVQFCAANDVQGNRCHDARVASVAAAHGIADILTQNVEDYSGWQGVSPLAPADV